MGRFLLALVFLVVLPVAPAAAQELTLSVAVSLKEAVDELGSRFMKANPGVLLRYNLGSSGALQKQIEAGAPADVFLSAAQRQMDALDQAGLLLPDSRRLFAGNVLIAIRPQDSGLDVPGPSDLLDRRVRRIVVGNPGTVPAGQYALQSLRALGLWDRLQPKLVLVDDVRQALDSVTRGEADVGFVYATDAVLRTGRLRFAFAFPEDIHEPIVYPAAVLKSARHPELARAFVDLLVSADGRAVLAKLGFELPGAVR